MNLFLNHKNLSDSEKLVWKRRTAKKTEQFEKRIEITDQHLKIHDKSVFSLKIHQKGRNCIHVDGETTTTAISFRAPEQFFSYTWLTFLRRVIHVVRSCKIWPFFKKKQHKMYVVFSVLIEKSSRKKRIIY